jgi:hypothetical protein
MRNASVPQKSAFSLGDIPTAIKDIIIVTIICLARQHEERHLALRTTLSA